MATFDRAYGTAARTGAESRLVRPLWLDWSALFGVSLTKNHKWLSTTGVFAASQSAAQPTAKRRDCGEESIPYRRMAKQMSAVGYSLMIDQPPSSPQTSPARRVDRLRRPKRRAASSINEPKSRSAATW